MTRPRKTQRLPLRSPCQEAKWEGSISTLRLSLAVLRGADLPFSIISAAEYSAIYNLATSQ